MLGCQTTQIDYSDKKSPCSDSTYLALKTKAIDSLSNREFQYLMKLENDCRDFRSDIKTENSSRESNKTALAILGVGAILIAVGVVVYFATKKKTIEISY